MAESQRMWETVMSSHGREVEFWLEYANLMRLGLVNVFFEKLQNKREICLSVSLFCPYLLVIFIILFVAAICVCVCVWSIFLVFLIFYFCLLFSPCEHDRIF